MSDKEILQAAYTLLTKRGNELAGADDEWDHTIDRAQHYLGLLIMRLMLGQDLTGNPPLMPQSIKCPQCGLVSHHPQDIENKYCGNCHQFHADMK
jgi:ribosomal protein S27AE